jgi:hypothetical protein
MLRSTAILGWCALLFALGAARADEPPGRFDGEWTTLLTCAPAAGALPYSYEFSSTVRNGTLHGERGTRDAPGWLQLDGRIAPDGAAEISAQGLVGSSRAAVGERPRGTPYRYRIDAKFSQSAGTGHRVAGRTCTVSFSRKAPAGGSP